MTDSSTIITKAKPLPFVVERLAFPLDTIPDSKRPKLLPDTADWARLTLWEQITWLTDNAISYGTLAVKLLPYIIQFLAGYAMGNWKTTISAVVAAIFAVLSHFNIVLPESLQEPIILLGLVLVGFFAGDAKQSKEAGK